MAAPLARALETAVRDGIFAIDCQDRGSELSASYLLHDAGEVALVDNGTAAAAPLILAALARHGFARGQVRYLVVTHAHLDHAGATAALLEDLPRADVLAHPLAARHLAQPALLAMSARSVFGAVVHAARFGPMLPVPQARLRPVADGEEVPLGTRVLRFLHTPGHTAHHCSVLDRESGTLFTGDSFGCALPGKAGTRALPLTPPIDFELAASLSSLQRMLALAPRRLCLTHYGAIDDVTGFGAGLLQDLPAYWDLAQAAVQREPQRAQAVAACSESCARHFRALACMTEADLPDTTRAILRDEWRLNAQGLVDAVLRERRPARPHPAAVPTVTGAHPS
jgi:glyoxylase-like metal-dependent hydrolase (beta-lactamase superfamily II)